MRPTANVRPGGPSAVPRPAADAHACGRVAARTLRKAANGIRTVENPGEAGGVNSA
jgi:hypothetical protein